MEGKWRGSGGEVEGKGEDEAKRGETKNEKVVIT